MRTLEDWKEENEAFNSYREALLSDPATQEDIEYQEKVANDFLEQIFDGQQQARAAILTIFGIDYGDCYVATIDGKEVRCPRVFYPERIPDKTDNEGWKALLFAIVKTSAFDEAARAAQAVLDEAQTETGELPSHEIIRATVLKAAQEAFRVTQREPAGYLAFLKSKRVPELDDLPEGIHNRASDALCSFIPTQVQLSRDSKNYRLRRALNATEDTPTAILLQRLMERIPQVLPIVCEEYRIEEPVRPGKKERISEKRSRSLVSRVITEIDREAAPLKERVFEPQKIEDFITREEARISLRNASEDSMLKKLELRRLISGLSNKLSKRQREVILLDSEGYTDKQIAERLNMSVGSVKTHLFRARRNIQRLKESSSA